MKKDKLKKLIKKVIKEQERRKRPPKGETPPTAGAPQGAAVGGQKGFGDKVLFGNPGTKLIPPKGGFGPQPWQAWSWGTQATWEVVEIITQPLSAQTGPVNFKEEGSC